METCTGHSNVLACLLCLAVRNQHFGCLGTAGFCTLPSLSSSSSSWCLRQETLHKVATKVNINVGRLNVVVAVS